MEVSIDVMIDRREYHTVHVDIDCHDANIRNEEDLHHYINEHVHVLDHTSSSSCYENECTDYEQNDINWEHDDFASSEDDGAIDIPMPSKTAPRPDLFLS
jgi:hypothetical protein